MTSLGLATTLYAVMLAANPESYADAHKAATELGRPMVIMVGAEWCAACQQLKQNGIPQARERGILRKVAFGVVDYDHERELGAQLLRGGPLPQLLFYRRTADGWRLRRLIGNQDVNAIEKFVNEGVADDEAEKQSEKAHGSLRTGE
jgi:thioredoxin-like negative regulator of GroEL